MWERRDFCDLNKHWRASYAVTKLAQAATRLVLISPPFLPSLCLRDSCCKTEYLAGFCNDLKGFDSHYESTESDNAPGAIWDWQVYNRPARQVFGSIFDVEIPLSLTCFLLCFYTRFRVIMCFRRHRGKMFFVMLSHPGLSRNQIKT